MESNIPFYKLQATGNDFVFFKFEDLPSQHKDFLQWVPEICHRQRGVGADGVAIIKMLKPNEFQWTFYNSDGHEANMCGNAARCAVVFYQQVIGGTQELLLHTLAGDVRGTSSQKSQDKKVSFLISLNGVQKFENPMGGQFPVAYIINTGVPHAVIPVTEPWSLRPCAQELSRHVGAKEFGPGGGNLTFVEWPKDNVHGGIIQAVTLERGVNDFTLSCGTGVIAAVAVHSHLFKHKNKMGVNMPGGLLHAQVDHQTGQVTLEGPAEITFRGVL